MDVPRYGCPTLAALLFLRLGWASTEAHRKVRNHAVRDLVAAQSTTSHNSYSCNWLRSEKQSSTDEIPGIALEAGASLIVDKGAVAAEADRLGLFVVGVTP